VAVDVPNGSQLLAAVFHGARHNPNALVAIAPVLQTHTEVVVVGPPAHAAFLVQRTSPGCPLLLPEFPEPHDAGGR